MFSTRVISASFGLLFLLVATTSTAETTYLPPGGSTINQNHPERRPHEYLLTNSSNCPSFIKNTSYETARCGNFATDNDGNRVNGLQPVFVMSQEYHKQVPQSVLTE